MAWVALTGVVVGEDWLVLSLLITPQRIREGLVPRRHFQKLSSRGESRPLAVPAVVGEALRYSCKPSGAHLGLPPTWMAT